MSQALCFEEAYGRVKEALWTVSSESGVGSGVRSVEKAELFIEGF